jgi:hypothetical protein
MQRLLEGIGGGEHIAMVEFISADDATANRIERRTYEVTGCRGAWVIDRAAVERLV